MNGRQTSQPNQAGRKKKFVESQTLGLVVTSTLVQFGQSPHTCKHFQAHYPSSNEAFAVENMLTDLKKYLTHLFNIFLVSHCGPNEGDEKHYNRNQQNHEYCHLNRHCT